LLHKTEQRITNSDAENPAKNAYRSNTFYARKQLLF